MDNRLERGLMSDERVLAAFSEDELTTILDWFNGYYLRNHTGEAAKRNGLLCHKDHAELVWKIHDIMEGNDPASPDRRLIRGLAKAKPDLRYVTLEELKEWDYELDEQGYVTGWYADGYIIGEFTEVTEEYVAISQWCPVDVSTVTLAYEGGSNYA